RDGVPVPELKRFTRQTNEFIAIGLLRQSNGTFALTQKGKLLADSVAGVFVESFDPSVATLAAPVFFYCGKQIFLCEIRPQFRRDVQFRVGHLPKKKVR